MNVVADRLDASPPKRTSSKQVPGDFREAVRLAVSAAEQEHQGFFRQCLHDVLDCTGAKLIRLASVPNNGVSRQTDLPSRSDDPTDPIAEQIAVTRDRHGGDSDEVVWH